MGIFVSDARTFHLQTNSTSYIFSVLENGDLGHVYYGAKVHHKNRYDSSLLIEERGFEPYIAKGQESFQPSLIQFEYASYGLGDFRHPAYQIVDANGASISQLVFTDYKIVQGKTCLEGLPSTHADENSMVESLIVQMNDDVLGLVAYLNYTIFSEDDTIVRSVRFENNGSQILRLTRAMSLQVDLPDSDYDFIHFSGAWLRERYFEKQPLRKGIQSVDSLRGSSSPQHNPFIMLARKETTEYQGEIYGFNLIYSGNHMEQIEVDHFQKTRVLVGINPFDFTWELRPETSFQTPEAVQLFTKQGFNDLSQKLAHFYQKHLIKPKFAYQDRPILINSWEAAYFDLNEEKLLRFADKAKELGIELLVVDDGWFGCRDDDSRSLGDWFVNQEKFPKGLKHVSDYVHGLGLQFGLWFEPEMVSEDSQLFRSHPEWRIENPNRNPSLGRKQYVLDFSNTQVVDAIYKQLSCIIDELQLDYIKWDMNRHITDMYSRTLSPINQKEFFHRYILGVYRLYEKLNSNYPNLLIESCASGGGRFDLGMMFYAPQAWTSDDTDPIERLKIQFGTSYGYSLAMMGNHISTSPNHQSGRETSIKLRSEVAYFGLLGYELDITSLSDATFHKLKEQVAFYKSYRKLFQFGRFYRLRSPFGGEKNKVTWQVVSDDQKVSIVANYYILAQLNPVSDRLKLQGLDPNKQYRVSGYEELFYGDELMNMGLELMISKRYGERVLTTKEFDSQLFILEEK